MSRLLAQSDRGGSFMTGAELKAIRKSLGLSVIQFARALGYAGNDNTASVQIRRYECGSRPIPPRVARLAEMYARHGVPDQHLSRPRIVGTDLDQ